MSFDLSSGSQPLLRGPQVPINMPKTENSLYTGSLWYHIYVPAVEKAFGAMKICQAHSWLTTAHMVP